MTDIVELATSIAPTVVMLLLFRRIAARVTCSLHRMERRTAIAGQFTDIDRSVHPAPLQHAAVPRALSVELLEDGFTAIAEAQGWRIDPAPPAGELARLEVRTAERDRAIDVLAELERIIRSVGGYMAPEDQVWLRDARALLVEHGRIEPEARTVWADRGPPR